MDADAVVIAVAIAVDVAKGPSTVCFSYLCLMVSLSLSLSVSPCLPLVSAISWLSKQTVCDALCVVAPNTDCTFLQQYEIAISMELKTTICWQPSGK